MADGQTINYGFVKPEPGGSDDTWGDKINANLDHIDALIKSNSDQIAGIDTGVADGSVTTPKIVDGNVTNAKLADVPSLTVKGRTAGGSGSPSDINMVALTDFLRQFDDAQSGIVPPSGGGVDNFMRADGTWAKPTVGSAEIVDGSVTNPKIQDGAVTTPKIQNGAVTFDKMQNVTGPVFIGRQTAVGVPQVMSPAEATALLPIFDGAKGLVPATGGATGRYLRDDGWASITFPATAIVRSVEALGSITSAQLPGVDGQTVIYCGSYWDSNKRGGGFFYLNGVGPITPTWRIDFMDKLDGSNRKWTRLIEPQGIDWFFTGAKDDALINGSTGAVTGTDNYLLINKVAEYILAATVGTAWSANVVPVKVSGGGGVFYCSKPVDFAKVGDAGKKWFMDLTGTCIASGAQGSLGEVAFDLTACESAHILGGVVYGDPTKLPAVGFFTCRLGGTSDDMRFDRPMAFGEYLYAAGHNSGGENVHWEQGYYSNRYMGPCYGMAQDAHTYLRYDPPVACTCDGGNPMKVTRTDGQPHGMPANWMVYMGTRGDDGMRYPITPVGGDVNSFTIPFNNTGGAAMSVQNLYFRARYWSQSSRVLATDDIIQPYVGDGAFTSNLNGGECIAPYGIAGLLDSAGGRRRMNCRVSGTIYDDPSWGGITKPSQAISGGNVMRVDGHGLSNPIQAWPPKAFYYRKGSGALATGLYRIMSVVDANNLVMARLDGTAVSWASEGNTGATVMLQRNYGGYGIHWITQDKFETPIYENIHMEAGPGKDIAHGSSAHIYIQNIIPMRKPVWDPPRVTYIKGTRFAEHTAHGELALFIIDTRTISQLQWDGEIRIADFGNYDGGDVGFEGTGKIFRAHDGTNFVSPTGWKIRGPLYLDKASNGINTAVDYKGDFIDTTSGENKSRRAFQQSIVYPAGGVFAVNHGCYKTPSYANARLLNGGNRRLEIDAISATQITLHLRTSTGADDSGTFTTMIEATV